MDAIMGWRVAYGIASARNDTQRGAGHLSDNAMRVINAAIERDNATMMRAIMRGALAGIGKR